MDIEKFKADPTKFEKRYSPSALFSKIRNTAQKAGIKLVYAALLLYYSTLDKDLPIKDRAMIIAALGYFILPADFIPDAIPGGFADDTAALVFVLKRIRHNLTPATKAKAKERLREWFDYVSDSDLHIPWI